MDRLVELGDDLARPQPPALAPQPLDERRGRAHQRQIVLDHVGDVRPQHLDGDRRAVGQVRRNAPAQPRRSRPGVRSNVLNTSSSGRPKTRTIVATTRSDANGGTRSCSSASSSAMSGGSRSRRVDSICPNLMKIGPRSSSARRRRTPRGAREVAPEQRVADRKPQRPQARMAERQIVETVPERDDDDAEEPTQAHAGIVRAAPRRLPVGYGMGPSRRAFPRRFRGAIAMRRRASRSASRRWRSRRARKARC